MRTLIAFAALAMAATSAAHAATPREASALTGRETIAVDEGPGRRVMIVRNGGGADGAAPGESEVLDYRDGAGARVRVYADHPVTRADVEASIRTAEHDADQARARGLRAAEDGRREAAEGRREAEAARQEAARAREEGLRAAEEGRREAALGRREAERAREEARAERDAALAELR